MATQKDKLMKAHMMACSIKSIASHLENDARDFGVNFAKSYANELKSLADDYLKIK